jgi:hypothetical protein
VFLFLALSFRTQKGRSDNQLSKHQGMNIVFVGDLSQLKPVSEENKKDTIVCTHNSFNAMYDLQIP